MVSKKAKIVILGDERTGKTSIAKRYCLTGLTDGSKMNDYLFDWKEQITIRATHFQRKEYLGPKEDHELTIDIWDTPGQQRYKTLNQAYLRGADGVIIVYNAADQNNENAKRIKNQVQELRDFLPEDRPIMILGNHYDLLQNQMNIGTFVD